MRSKFVAPPPSQSTSRRVTAPTSNEVTEGALMGAIRSFSAGVSAGPSGQRPDFCQTVGGEWRQAGSPTAAEALKSAGSWEGSRRTAGVHWGSERHRSPQEGERRLGRCPPRMFGGNDPTEIENLSSHLLPHQLVVGVPAGIEAMAHVTRQWRDDNANDNCQGPDQL